MALKLEDLLNKKKEPNQILDLSKIKIQSQEEFDKYFDKIPEYKIRPEKVRPEDARIREEVSFKPSRKEGRRKKEFPYDDACPVSMRGVRLEDLAAVDISWRMLTMLRPKNRLEEDIFSRLVELGKLRLATRNLEAKQLSAQLGGGPGSQSALMMAQFGIFVMKTRRGATETRIKICNQCGIELCTGIYCKEFPYDCYTRLIVEEDEDVSPGSRRGSKMKQAGKPGAPVKPKAPKGAPKRPIKSKEGLKLKKKGKAKSKKKRHKSKTTKSGSASDSDE